MRKVKVVVVVVVVSLLITRNILLKSQLKYTGSDTLSQLHPITTFVLGI
jgi:hypothetical protein